MATKYISLEAAIETVRRYQIINNAHFFYDDGYNDVIDMVILGLNEKIPAVDVRPVVHGRWLIKDHKMMGKTPCCSECGKFEPMKRNYCPNCGADMREEGDRENV